MVIDVSMSTVAALYFCMNVLSASESFFIFFFNDTATTEIYTRSSSAASDVYKRQQRHHLAFAGADVDVLDVFGLQPEPRLGLQNDLPAVSYTHLRAHETVLDLVCRLLLEKKKPYTYQ